MSHDGIEKGKLEDLPRILQIYASARKFMKQSGNPRQWGDSFPPEDLLAKDIEKEQLYVVKPVFMECLLLSSEKSRPMKR